MLRAPSSLTLSVTRDGASTTSLGNLFLCFTTLIIKHFFFIHSLNLSCFSLRLFPLVHSQQTLAKGCWSTNGSSLLNVFYLSKAFKIMMFFSLFFFSFPHLVCLCLCIYKSCLCSQLPFRSACNVAENHCLNECCQRKLNQTSLSWPSAVSP